MGDWSVYIAQLQACSADDGGGIFSLDGAPWCQYGSVSFLRIASAFSADFQLIHGS